MTLDATDVAILRLLQQNARVSTAEIARRIELAPSAVHQRIRVLEEEGIVEGYGCALNARALGFGLVAYLRIQTHAGACRELAGSSLAALPEVQEVHRVVGEDCFLVKVRVCNTDALAVVLEEKIARIPGIASTRASVVVRTVKEAPYIPMLDPVGG